MSQKWTRRDSVYVTFPDGDCVAVGTVRIHEALDLPTGISMDPISAMISGGPQVAGPVNVQIAIRDVVKADEERKIASKAIAAGFGDPAIWILLPNGFALGKLGATDAVLFDLWREGISRAGLKLIEG